ncbi:MAG: right-handed parallel beta-helix repeat-containing protein [Candidatus Bathyarchaeia archaeon]|jgi:parallel beta-helix repeat protein
MLSQKKTMALAIVLAILSAFIVAGISYLVFPDQPSTLPSEPIFNIYRAVPVTPIYIDSAGNINPPTAPIQRSADTYSLTEDLINYTLVIQRSNVTFDGKGHKIQGFINGINSAAEGIVIEEKNNITIENVDLKQFYTGISLTSSSNITISKNTLTDIHSAISLDSCNNTLITGNTADNIISAIQIANRYGREESTNNTITQNHITNALTGISITPGSFNIVNENTLVNVDVAIVEGGNATVISKNSMVNGMTGITVAGTYGGEDDLFIGGSNCTIFRNYIANFSETGITVGGANNTIYENMIKDAKTGLKLEGTNWINASNNTFFRNNFVNNSQNIAIGNNTNVNFWDNGEEGNYWSNYRGTDSNSDGIGDTPHIIDDNNLDNYPLMAPYGNWTTEQSITDQVLWAALLVGLAALIALICVGLVLLANKGRTKHNRAQ